jgi:hypothetical protein
MQQTKYAPPVFLATAFHCPRCGVFASQRWFHAAKAVAEGGAFRYLNALREDVLAIAECDHCAELSFWHRQAMICPDGGAAPLAHSEMPSDVADDFNEARSVVGKSPKAARRSQDFRPRLLPPPPNRPRHRPPRVISNRVPRPIIG